MGEVYPISLAKFTTDEYLISAVFVMFSNVNLLYAEFDIGMVAYYPFNGTAQDETFNGHDGTVFGATLTADKDGNPNSAYHFDGVDDYIKIPHHPDLNIQGDLSISVWVTQETNTGNRVLLTKGRDCLSGYFFGWSGPAVFGVSHEDRWCHMDQVSAPIPLNEWHFVTVTVDSSALKLKYYLDGVLKRETDMTDFTFSDNTYPLVIGRHFTFQSGGGNYEYPFAGSVDELRIYNRALTADEIQELYSSYQTVVDTDKDGVPDEDDQCLETPADAIVNADGCSIPDICPCENNWTNHGKFVSCVSNATETFVEDGLISEEQKDAIVAGAAQSTCGKKK